MSSGLSSREVIDIAIGIERRGISFYDVMARSADDEASRAVFEGLVEMEREHLEMFQEMLKEVDKSPAAAFINSKRSDYLEALVDSAVFTDELIIDDIVTGADTDIKAVELGINAEKDSLLFYYEIRDSLPQRMFPLLDRIIAEEKTHLRQLTVIKKHLAGGPE
jgi:rubrerythrin